MARALGDEFALVTSEQMVGVCLFVYAKQSFMSSIAGVVTETCLRGAGGKVGTKGSVMTRFTAGPCSLLLCCAHLAAGQSKVAERNADYEHIIKRFPPTDVASGRTARALSNGVAVEIGRAHV